MASIVSSMSVVESLRWMWLWFFVEVQMTVSLVGVWERETQQLKRIITEGSGIYAKQWTRCGGFHHDDCYRRLWECRNTENGCIETCISVLIDAITPVLRRMSYCLWVILIGCITSWQTNLIMSHFSLLWTLDFKSLVPNWGDDQLLHSGTRTPQQHTCCLPVMAMIMLVMWCDSL